MSAPARGFVLLWVVFSLFCLVWVVFASLKTNRTLFSNVWGIPVDFRWQNYKTALVTVKLGTDFINSIVVVFASILVILAVSSLAAYALSRIDFPGREFVTNTFVVGMGIPYQILLIPLVGLLVSLHIHNSLFGLIMVYVALSLPFNIFLLTGFFRSLPSELEEAAAVDGASEFRAFWQIMLPLARPGLVTAAIFNFVGLWNEYMLALVTINSQQKMTISLGLYGFAQSMQYASDWVGLFAGVVIVMIPSVVIYFLLSEQVTAGITMGAAKG